MGLLGHPTKEYRRCHAKWGVPHLRLARDLAKAGGGGETHGLRGRSAEKHVRKETSEKHLPAQALEPGSEHLPQVL